MTASPLQTWVVLGASSAIARAFAHAAARRGAGLILAGRDTPDLAITAADLKVRHQVSVSVVDFDARDAASATKFAARCRDLSLAPLSIFLAFGVMPAQEASDTDPKTLEALVSTNFTGAAAVLNAFAPMLEAQKAGHVVVIGSIAGDRGRLKNYSYGATKAALHTYAQGLRARLCRSGVTVLTVKPGFTDTAMTFGQPGMFFVASPEALADAILRAVRRHKLVLYYPSLWWAIMLIIKHIPERIFQRLNI